MPLLGTGTDDTAKGIAIIKATDYMELMFGERWKGSLSDDATTLSFPRTNMYDRKGNLLTSKQMVCP